MASASVPVSTAGGSAPRGWYGCSVGVGAGRLPTTICSGRGAEEVISMSSFTSWTVLTATERSSKLFCHPPDPPDPPDPPMVSSQPRPEALRSD